MPFSQLSNAKLLLALVFLPFPPACQLTSADDQLKSIQSVLRHIPNAGKILSMDMSVSVDGRFTAVVSNDENHVCVIVPNGNKWRVFSPSEEFESPASVALHDINGDGTIELVIGSDRVCVYAIRERQLSLLWESESQFGSESPAPRVGFGDCNSDGTTDLVVINYKDKDKEPNQQSVYLFEQRPAAEPRFVLADTLLLTDRHGFHSTSGLVVADFLPADGSEIAIGNDNGFLWLVELRDSKLQIVHTWEVPSGGAVGTGMSAGNIDGDPNAELFIGTNGGSIFMYDFVGDSIELVATGDSGRLAYGVNAADLDSDGIDEFILSRGKLGYAKMEQQDVVLEVYTRADKTLKRSWSQETVDLPRNMIADVDGDGQLEIVVFSLLGESSKVEILKPDLRPKR